MPETEKKKPRTSSPTKRKYNSSVYDIITISSIKKGQKEIIKTYAESRGFTLNQYIKTLIEADMVKNGENISLFS